MIPTLLLFGLLLGRWWKTALVVGTTGWLILLWADPGTPSFEAGFLASTAALALANTAVGVGLHQGVRRLWHRARHQRGLASSAGSTGSAAVTRP